MQNNNLQAMHDSLKSCMPLNNGIVREEVIPRDIVMPGLIQTRVLPTSVSTIGGRIV